jgi:hypothetical protein
VAANFSAGGGVQEEEDKVCRVISLKGIFRDFYTIFHFHDFSMIEILQIF